MTWEKLAVWGVSNDDIPCDYSEGSRIYKVSCNFYLHELYKSHSEIQ